MIGALFPICDINIRPNLLIVLPRCYVIKKLWLQFGRDMAESHFPMGNNAFLVMADSTRKEREANNDNYSYL